MRKHTLKLIALMVCVLLALSGCSMIAVDPVKDAAEPVIKVNDVTLTKGELQNDFNNNVAYSSMMYSYFGLNYSVDQIVDIVRESFVNSEVQNQVLLLKAKELGLDTFTEEEEAAFQEEFETAWSDYLASADSSIEGVEDMTDEEKLDAEIKMLESIGETRESFEKRQRNSAIVEKVHDYAIKDVEVTEEEIQTAYQEKVDADQASYSENALAFEQAVTNGTSVAWVPEGYRAVLHILLKYDEERASEVTSLNTELDEINTKLSDLAANAEADAAEDTAEETAQEAAEEAAEDVTEEVTEETPAEDTAEETPAEETAAEDTAEETPAEEEAAEETAAEEPAEEEPAEEPETEESLNARKAEIEARLAEIQKEFQGELQETIDDIRARAEAGEDFRTLIDEYSADTGMAQGTTGYENGYYVSAQSAIWEQSFTDGAMALENKGEVSEPVFTTNGIHLIYYMDDVQSGAVDLETLRDGIYDEELSEKQSAVYSEALETWQSACTVKTWPDRLSYTGK